MLKTPRCAIAIDLGGTRIKAGLVDEEGRVVAHTPIDTQADRGPDHVISRIVSVAQTLRDDANRLRSTPIGVAVGAPGALSQRRGIIIAPPNLPGWREVPIAGRVAAGVGLPALLENDANAAALGECWRGAGQGVADLVMFTLGTGVGSGIIVGGRIVRGHFETAGELGHCIVVPDGEQCGCGQRGCLETYVSASSVARRLKRAVEAGQPSICAEAARDNPRFDARDVALAATAGDALAGRIWDDACRLLAIACVNAQHAVNPAVIVLAGGMAAAGETLLSPVRQHFARQTWRDVPDRPEIRLGLLGDDAGVVGAAAVLLRGGSEHLLVQPA